LPRAKFAKGARPIAPDKSRRAEIKVGVVWMKIYDAPVTGSLTTRRSSLHLDRRTGDTEVSRQRRDDLCVVRSTAIPFVAKASEVDVVSALDFRFAFFERVRDLALLSAATF
jgi:hypothetical protein